MCYDVLGEFAVYSLGLVWIEGTCQTTLDTFYLTTTIPSTYHHNHADLNL